MLAVLKTLAVALPLLNYENSQHLVYVEVGTPPQRLPLLLDSGSSSFWVPSSSCPSLGCQLHSSFNPELSSSYLPDDIQFEVEYRSGWILGEYAYDTVHLLNLTIPHMTLGLVTKELGNAFFSLPFAGILGLGFGTTDYPSLLDKLVSLQVLRRNIVGMYLSPSPQKAGEIRFGEVNPAYVRSKWVYASVVSRQFWDVEVEEVVVNGVVTAVCQELREVRQHCVVAIDTGTAILAGPTSFVSEVQNLLPIRPDCTGADEFGDIEILIAGETVTLKPEDYVIYEDGECKLALMPMDVSPPRGPLIVLGGVFLRKFYTVLDRDSSRVGFSEVKWP